MTEEHLNEIMGILPKGRTLFPYFQDRYAMLLLEFVLRSPCPLARLKKSPFAGLLNKAATKAVLARTGRPTVCALDFQSYWPHMRLDYRLTVGQWPPASKQWDRFTHQTTLRGRNLVLQLNFNVDHNRKLQERIRKPIEAFVDYNHPVARRPQLTLAWSRIDLDLETGEALIEEIQNDWIRDTDFMRREARWSRRYVKWKRYVEEQLKPHIKLWDEAMLAATIWFLYREVGIDQIFYHTFQSGTLMKRIRGDKPPRSLYTTLPRRFCFTLTHNGPLFVRDHAECRLRKQLTRPGTQWHYLDLNDPLCPKAPAR